MRRRRFIVMLLSAPALAYAQPRKRVRIGFVTWGSSAVSMRLDDLRQGLRDFGYVEGENLELNSYFTDGNERRTKEVIEALIAKPVDVLVVWQTPAVHIAKRATQTIPIVMMVADALATGLVTSLARPGGNLTGVSNTGPDLAGKRLETLRDLRPNIRKVAFLGSSNDPNGPTFAGMTSAAAEKLGMVALVRLVPGAESLDEALFAEMKREGVEAIIAQPVFTSYRNKIVELAANYQMAVTSDFALFAEAGALFSLGVDDGIQLRRTAYFVDRIMNGARPGELPIEQPTKFQLVLNAEAARKLGWSLPALLKARADRIID